MTIEEAITKIDALKHNTYSAQEKADWLSTLDGMIRKLILEAHEGAVLPPFSRYDAELCYQELLVPAPFDTIYLRWLEACIDYANGEYDKYNHSIAMYNAELKAYESFYTRTHTPVKKGTRFLF